MTLKLIQGREKTVREDRFVLKAISPDNDREINQVIDLFRSVWGENFPIRSVYGIQFWRTHIGMRFISLVAKDGDKVVGHLAITPDADNPRNIQLSFPLCHEDYFDILPLLGQSVWEIVERQAAKNGWEALYYIVFGALPMMQRFGLEVLKTHETALLPEYFPETTQGEKGRVDVLVTERVLAQNLSAKDLYIPKTHLAVTEHLYKPLGLQRQFDRVAKSTKQKGLRTDSGLKLNTFGSTEVSHAFIEPSQVGSVKDLVKELKTSDHNSLYAFVNAEDPLCPVMAEALEEAGYRFCGILPLLQGRDSIVYWKGACAKLEAKPHYSAAMRMLLEYIKHYDLKKALKSR